jgi:hypothetical protein
MELTRRLVAFLAAAVTILACASTAQAGVVFTVAPGASPDVAVDAAGTAHVVWQRDPDGILYCQVRRGATACTSTPVRLTAPLSPVGGASHVFLGGGSTVMLSVTRCCPVEIDLYTSTDGGATFAAPVKIGAPPGDWSDVAVVPGPGATLSSFSLLSYQNAPLAGPTETSEAVFSYGAVVGISAGAGLFAGTTPVHVFSDGTAMQFVRYGGSGSLNDGASWTAPAPIGPGDAPSVAGGAAGLVVVARTGAVGSQRLVARKFDGSAFGSPVGVSETGGPDLATVSAAPSNGRFTAVWVCNACTGVRELRVSQSSDGARWSAPRAIVSGAETFSSFRPRTAVAADGQGFAVWDTGTSVRAASLDPPGGGTPAPNKTTQTTVGDQTVGFDSPKGCVDLPHPILLRVVTKTKKDLIGKRPKTFVKQVVFSVDKAKVTDRKKKFSATFQTAGFARRSTHSGIAKITFAQQAPKKTFTKTIKKSFKIC